MEIERKYLIHHLPEDIARNIARHTKDTEIGRAHV